MPAPITWPAEPMANTSTTVNPPGSAVPTPADCKQDTGTDFSIFTIWFRPNSKNVQTIAWRGGACQNRDRGAIASRGDARQTEYCGQSRCTCLFTILQSRWCIYSSVSLTLGVSLRPLPPRAGLLAVGARPKRPATAQHRDEQSLNSPLIRRTRPEQILASKLAFVVMTWRGHHTASRVTESLRNEHPYLEYA